MTEEEKRVRLRIQLRKKQRQREILIHTMIGSAVAFGLLALVLLFLGNKRADETAGGWLHDKGEARRVETPEIKQELLPVNPYSRPGDPLTKINGIVVHYTGNPNTSAMQNRNYFAGLADSHETSASSHFIVGLQGEIIQCVPCDEIAYASNERNADTISIECCIEDASGRFNAKTYRSLVKLTAWLMEEYDVDIAGVIRHYDVTGKQCPKYYVENEASWRAFKSEAEALLMQK